MVCVGAGEHRGSGYVDSSYIAPRGRRRSSAGNVGSIPVELSVWGVPMAQAKPVTYSLYGNMGVDYDFHCLRVGLTATDVARWIEHYLKTWRNVDVRSEK